MQSTYSFKAVALARTPFKEKFGVPRQPGLAPSAEGLIKLLPPYDRPEAVKGLEGYSHLWLLFIFHETQHQGWSPTVRPPRLGGNRRLGVFATRSTFRPNPIGLSCVQLLGIETEDGRVTLRVAGIDLIDGTPIVDIKPYIPFSDCHPEASAELVPHAPAALHVVFSETAADQCPPRLQTLIRDVLAQDPRPAYQDDQEREYGLSLDEFNIRFSVKESTVYVHAIAPRRHEPS